MFSKVSVAWLFQNHIFKNYIISAGNVLKIWMEMFYSPIPWQKHKRVDTIGEPIYYEPIYQLRYIISQDINHDILWIKLSTDIYYEPRYVMYQDIP